MSYRYTAKLSVLSHKSQEPWNGIQSFESSLPTVEEHLCTIIFEQLQQSNEYKTLFCAKRISFSTHASYILIGLNLSIILAVVDIFLSNCTLGKT